MARKQREEFHFIINFIPDKKKQNLIHNIIVSISNFLKEFEYDSFNLGISGIDEIEYKKELRCIFIEQMASKFSKKLDLESPNISFFVDFRKNIILLHIHQVFIGGNYCKFSRNIAQTQHFCRKCRGKGCEECSFSGFITKMSVEQLLSKVLLPKFDSKQLIFHGGGREDVDVLMLGSGRGFVAELTIPKKRNIDLKKIENEINKKFKGKISVNNLKFVTKKKISEIKNYMHDKIYSAKIIAYDNIDFEILNKLIDKEIEVEQLTPTRVSKRRVLMKRDKLVILKEIKKINDKEFEIILKCSHGTYVKEFISGDDDKTNPSISKILGINCECRELDVLEII